MLETVDAALLGGQGADGDEERAQMGDAGILTVGVERVMGDGDGARGQLAQKAPGRSPAQRLADDGGVVGTDDRRP